MIYINGSAVSSTQILVWFAIALVSGGVAEALIGYSHAGVAQAIVVGLLGAFLGTWSSGALHLAPLLLIQAWGLVAELGWSTIGAILVLLLVQSLRHQSRRRAGYTRRSWRHR